jgi:hypothetical protein
MDQQLSGQPTPQLPRYRRLALRALPVSIQPRDLLLLKTIYEFPYSTAAQLSRLLPTGSINPQLRAYHDQRRLVCTGEDLHFERVGGVRREIRRRLQQLFHAVGGSYVQRHKIDNNSPILYTIAMRAVDVLAAEFDLDEAALARSARNRDPGEKFLRHARQRTNFRYAVTVAVDARPDIEIAYWLKDGSTKISITYKTYDGTIVEDTVIPDDILGIRWLKTGIVEPFLAESDKRKDYPRVRKKFIAYVHLLRQIKHGTATLPLAPHHVVRDMRRTGQVRSTQLVYSIAGQPVINFRVLWLAKGAERKEGLRRLARDMDGPQGEASGLFWFTHEAQYLDEPERVLETVWQKGRNDVWRPLLNQNTP